MFTRGVGPGGVQVSASGVRAPTPRDITLMGSRQTLTAHNPVSSDGNSSPRHALARVLSLRADHKKTAPAVPFGDDTVRVK